MTMAALLFLALAAAFICAWAATNVLATLGAAGAATTRIQKNAGAGGLSERLLRNGIPSLEYPALSMMRVRLVQQWCAAVVQAATLRGYATSDQAVASIALGASLCLLAAGTLLASPLAGVALVALMVVLVWSYACRVVEKRNEAVRDALPDALRMMSACFHAGFSLQQTFSQVAHESKGPLSEIFDRAARQLETGATANEVLDSIRTSNAVSELSFLSVALEVQHRAGGSMQHVLDATRESLESELELKRSLKVHTAQARLSARVVVGVTIAMVALLSLITEGFLEPFFASPMGLCLLTLAIVMQMTGILLVRRLLDVEVD